MKRGAGAAPAGEPPPGAGAPSVPGTMWNDLLVAIAVFLVSLVPGDDAQGHLAPQRPPA